MKIGLREFFHTAKIGFTRLFEPSLPYTPEEKRYGNQGEDCFSRAIRSYLPNCQIKKNIIVQTAEGNAEIDCLILYQNKLFAIEVKSWKGRLVEKNGKFVQYKQDSWTDETHTKTLKSPFKQLGRAIHLIRTQIPINAWLNAIVFFEGCDSVEIESDGVWFDEISTLASYIEKNGKSSWGNGAADFFEKTIAADYLYSRSWNNSLYCIVCEESLRFRTVDGISLTKQDIDSIAILHRWSYDELTITTHDGTIHTVKLENGSIYVIENGEKRRYAFSKLNHIQLSF